MRGYTAFLKKEWTENIRTYRVLILGIVLAAVGMMSPLLAKITPELLATFMPGDMKIEIPEPSAFDSYMQFFKNYTSMGLIALVLIFGGTLTNEYTKGTLVNLLTKGLSRNAVLGAKFTMEILLWTLGVLGSLLITWGYTIYLFPEDKVYNLLLSVFCLWLFGVFLLVVILLLSTFLESTMGVLMGTGVVVVILLLMQMVPSSVKFNPLSLASENVGMLVETFDKGSMYPAIGITAVCVLLLCLGAGVLFGKKRV